MVHHEQLRDFGISDFNVKHSYTMKRSVVKEICLLTADVVSALAVTRQL